jgi:hypothetical protein
MATLADLRGRVRDNFYSNHPGERPFRQVLAAGYTVGAATVVVPDGTKWAVGEILENETTGEQMLITSIATHTLTVARGFNGTTAVAGVAGEVINKNPRITVRKIDDAIEAIVYDLRSHGVYRLATVELTPLPNEWLYAVDLSELVDPPGVIDVFYVDASTGLPISLPFKQRQGLPTAVAATTQAIVLGSWDISGASTAYAQFGQGYTDVTQLPARLEEIVVLGATGRVMGAMIGQIIQDPGQHANRTVPQGQPGRDARWYQAEHLVTVRREAALLAAQNLGAGNVRSGRTRRFRP